MPHIAYLDESGTHTKDYPVCVAAGYFGGTHYWKQFALDWQRSIRSHGLKEFHASRFWSGGLGGKTTGEYAGWSKADCNGFLEELLSIIGRYKIWPTGSAIVAADWNQLTLDERRYLTGGVYRNGEYQEGGAPSKPYFAAFLFFVQSVARYYDKGHSVDFVIDESRALNGYAQEYFQRIKTGKFPHADKLGTIQPANSQHEPGLQAADLVAYLILRQTRENPIHQEIDQDTPLGRAVRKARNVKGDFKLLGKHAFDLLLAELRRGSKGGGQVAGS